jgi:hypothetical protein
VAQGWLQLGKAKLISRLLQALGEDALAGEQAVGKLSEYEFERKRWRGQHGWASQDAPQHLSELSLTHRLGRRHVDRPAKIVSLQRKRDRARDIVAVNPGPKLLP